MVGLMDGLVGTMVGFFDGREEGVMVGAEVGQRDGRALGGAEMQVDRPDAEHEGNTHVEALGNGALPNIIPPQF